MSARKGLLQHQINYPASQSYIYQTRLVHDSPATRTQSSSENLVSQTRVFSASDTGNVHSVTTPQASRTELQAASFSSISVLHVASKRYCHTLQSSRTVCTPCILSKKKRSLQLITSTGPVEGMVVRICVKFSEHKKISNRRIQLKVFAGSFGIFGGERVL